MAQALTARVTVAARRIEALLAVKIQDESFSSPAIQGVCYGDQFLIPSVPWICVEPSPKSRQWPPTPTDMTENTLEVGIYVYYMNSELGASGSRLFVDELAEDVEFFLNANHRRLQNAAGDDLVIYSYVYRVD